jgi:predicted transcriptional regulator
MKYRSRQEIIDSMLRSIKTGATKTHIMYNAYMSYSQLKEYLKLLQDRDMITFDPGSQLYRLTENGLKFMDAYDKIRELVPNALKRNELVEQPVPRVEAFVY